MRPARLAARAPAKTAGRVLLVSLFLGSAFEGVTHWRATIQLMAAHHMPLPALFLAGAVEVLGRVGVVIGWHPREAALALVVFDR